MTDTSIVICDKFRLCFGYMLEIKNVNNLSILTADNHFNIESFLITSYFLEGVLIIERNRRANNVELNVLWSEGVRKQISSSTCHREPHKMEMVLILVGVGCL